MTNEDLRRKREEADAANRGLAVPSNVDEVIARIRKDLTKKQAIADGTVMRWVHVYERGGRFTYSALYTGGFWHITGKGERYPTPISHDDLMSRLVNAGHRIFDLEVASTWKEVTL